MKPLDFLIVGAQKCATTSLFEHLRSHPDISMPLEKEVPFFTKEGCGEADWRAYAERHFGDDTGKLRGKATPQYLCDESAPERIRALMPDVKIIAILRDPIDRTWSHYQMGKRRDTEPRDFDTAIDELLSEPRLARGRTGRVPTHAEGYESEGDFYVTWSEYGRMLKRYVDEFGSGQVLVLFSEDLRSDPGGTLDRLLDFIGLAPGYRPPTLEQVIHQGGGSNRVPHAWRVWLRERRLLYRLWECLPAQRRGRLRFLYEQWNVRRGPAPERRMSVATEDALRRHFADDLAELAALPLAAPPWLAQYASQ